MKIMLVCAAGASTGMLMNKMKKYWEKNGVDLDITAQSLRNYIDYVDDYDIILMGPQVSYSLDKVKEESNKPVGVIKPVDYGRGNCENIMKMAEELYKELN